MVRVRRTVSATTRRVGVGVKWECRWGRRPLKILGRTCLYLRLRGSLVLVPPLGSSFPAYLSCPREVSLLEFFASYNRRNFECVLTQNVIQKPFFLMIFIGIW